MTQKKELELVRKLLSDRVNDCRFKDNVIGERNKEIEKLLNENEDLMRRLKSRQEQILDINQWAQLSLSRADLRPRIIRGLVGDILNRTTD